MSPVEALAANRAAIRRVVAAHHARNPRVIGSVLRGEDTEDSDLDLLVDPMPETTLFDIAAIELQLKELLGIPVDVVTPGGLPDRARDQFLTKARPI